MHHRASTHSFHHVQGVAEEGLKKLARPFLSHRPSVAPELFRLDRLVQDRRRSLHLLKETFSTIEDHEVCMEDRELYVSELERRRQIVQELTQRRNALMPRYGEELLESVALQSGS